MQHTVQLQLLGLLNNDIILPKHEEHTVLAAGSKKSLFPFCPKLLKHTVQAVIDIIQYVKQYFM